MKRSETLIIILISVFMLASAGPASAQYVQEIVVPEGYELVDSVVYRPASAVDTALVGKTI